MKDRIAKVLEIEEAVERWGAKARFCRNVGCKSTASIEDWLGGKAKPSSKYRRAICKHYRVRTEWLDGEGGEMLENATGSRGRAASGQEKPSGVVREGLPPEARRNDSTRSDDPELDDVIRKVAGMDKVAAWYRSKAAQAERDHDALADRVARQLERIEQLALPGILPHKEGRITGDPATLAHHPAASAGVEVKAGPER